MVFGRLSCPLYSSKYLFITTITSFSLSDLAEQIAAIVVLTLIAVGILTACSLAQCYRTRTGFFAARRRRDHEARVSSTKAYELRQMFRVLSHTGHYDSAAAAERARRLKNTDGTVAKRNAKVLLPPSANELSDRPTASANARGIIKKCRHRSGVICGSCSEEKTRLTPLLEHDGKSEEGPGSGKGMILSCANT